MRFPISISTGIKLVLLFFLATQALALEQHEKLWIGVNTQGYLTEDKNWLYSFFTQQRYINESHPLQTFFVETGLGCRLGNDTSLFLGYRLSENHSRIDYFQSNLFFQQLNTQFKPNDFLRIISRSRLEEIKRSDHNQIAVVFRQRLAAEVQCPISNKIYPYFYDEVFFPLNKTDFIPHTLISQNRLFLGINYYLTKTKWLEIGYMNQYLSRVRSGENQLNHILSITYNC